MNFANKFSHENINMMRLIMQLSIPKPAMAESKCSIVPILYPSLKKITGKYIQFKPVSILHKILKFAKIHGFFTRFSIAFTKKSSQNKDQLRTISTKNY